MTNNQPTPSAVTDEMVKDELSGLELRLGYTAVSRLNEHHELEMIIRWNLSQLANLQAQVCNLDDASAYWEKKFELRDSEFSVMQKSNANLQAQVDSAKAYGMRWEEDCIAIFDALGLEPTTPENVASQKQNALDKCKWFDDRINLLTEERGSLRQQLSTAQAAMGVKDLTLKKALASTEDLTRYFDVYDTTKRSLIILASDIRNALTPATGQSIGKKE